MKKVYVFIIAQSGTTKLQRFVALVRCFRSFIISFISSYKVLQKKIRKNGETYNVIRSLMSIVPVKQKFTHLQAKALISMWVRRCREAKQCRSLCINCSLFIDALKLLSLQSTVRLNMRMLILHQESSP